MLMKLTLSFNELKKHLRLPSNSEIFQAGRTKRKKEKKGSLIEKAVRCFKGLEYLNQANNLELINCNLKACNGANNRNENNDAN